MMVGRTPFDSDVSGEASKLVVTGLSLNSISSSSHCSSVSDESAASVLGGRWCCYHLVMIIIVVFDARLGAECFEAVVFWCDSR